MPTNVIPKPLAKKRPKSVKFSKVIAAHINEAIEAGVDIRAEHFDGDRDYGFDVGSAEVEGEIVYLKL